MSSIRPLVAGNWKMNGVRASAAEIAAMVEWRAKAAGAFGADLMICPPATLIAQFAALLEGSGIALGGQDCHTREAGPFTGEISAPMLRDAGAAAVILGHSERRAGHGERDRDVKEKAAAAHAAGLIAIICVGETLGERRMGLTLDVIGRQLRGSLPDGCAANNTIVAYEPVWAIGSGLTPQPQEIAQAHGFIRARLADRYAEGASMRILYGGSVKPDNARHIFALPQVNGGLVGGASLKASEFCAIAAAYLA